MSQDCAGQRRIPIWPLMVLAMTGTANAQYNCNSRAVENALEPLVRARYGPTAFAQIQAFGEGQAVPLRMTITDVVTEGPLQGGLPGDLICTATGTFWRGDSNETTAFTAQIWIVTDPTRGSQVQLRAITP